MSQRPPAWDSYAKKSITPLFQAHYFFTVWRNYRLLLHGLNISHGSLLELGSSTGQISFRLTKRYQLSPTLVDTSAYALTLAKQYYKKRGVKLKTVKRNILKLNLGQKYDFVHSHGLLEHFTGENQEIVLFNHLKHLKEEGWLICWVPTPDIFYRLNRWYLECTGQWIFGFERPLSIRRISTLFYRKEIRIHKICHVPGWIGVAGQFQ